MILSFSFPQFEMLIKKGIKRFTIREDKHNRWREGMKIHFWRGSPRNPKNNPYSFGEGICSSVEICELYPCKNIVILYDVNNTNDKIEIKGLEQLNEFAVEDGFKSWEDLKQYFDEDFTGKLIRWDFFKCHFY